MWRLMLIVLVYAVYCQADLWKPAAEDDSKEGRIEQVHVVFRHGHREPMNTFPADQNDESSIWKNGPGQLTSLGKQQTYNLGRNLRARYRSLIPEKNSWRCIHATSSDSDRTLMSSASVLAGLIPPSEEDRFCELNWQPCPIHTTPQNLDNVLVANPRCTTLTNKLNEMAAKMERDDNIYDYLAKAMGKKTISANSICNIYTVLEIAKQSGVVFPKWCENYEVYDKLKHECARTLTLPAAATELIRLRSGPLLKKITHKTTKKDPPPTIYLYSTHDTVLGGLFGAFNINITEPPNFASVIIVEFRKVKKEHHAQLWYQLKPESDLVRASFPGCEPRCPAHKLERIMDPLIPDNWEAECGITENKDRENVRGMVDSGLQGENNQLNIWDI